AFLLACALAPAVLTRPLAALAWCLIAGVFLAGLFASGRHLLRLRRGGAAGLLRAHDPALASALRSAYELAAPETAQGSSAALRAAHARATAARASAIDPRVVTPWRELSDRRAF